MKIKLQILILSVYLISCKKEILKSKYEGTVLNYKTKIPVENAEIYLAEYIHGFQQGTIKIGKTYNSHLTLTDQNGKFNFEFKALRKSISDSYKKYVITCENYYRFEHEIQKHKKRNNNTFYIFPFSYYKVHVKNVNPLNYKDKFNGGGFDSELVGMNIDTLSESIKFEYVTLPENYKLEKTYSYNVIRNNNISYYHTTIIGSIADTVIYDIFY